MRRPSNRTSVSAIVDYWAARVDECDLSVDWSEAEEYCWRCGSPKDLTRCHIVPHSLGGKDEPSNFVLLCRACHEENPNVADPEIMWDWLMAYKSAFYNTFWQDEGLREYKFLYKRTMDEDLGFLAQNGVDTSFEALKPVISEAVNNSMRHFGQACPNKATAAGMYRMMIKDLARQNGLQLPDERPESLTRKYNPGYLSG